MQMGQPTALYTQVESVLLSLITLGHCLVGKMICKAYTNSLSQANGKKRESSKSFIT